MIVADVVKKLNLQVVTSVTINDKEVSGVYLCDLLSWVMSHASKGDIWITVQIHPNIVAVALLLEIPLIIIPESIEVEQVTIDKANIEHITIAQSDMNAYELCSALHDLGM